MLDLQVLNWQRAVRVARGTSGGRLGERSNPSTAPVPGRPAANTVRAPSVSPPSARERRPRHRCGCAAVR
jgi:hypothetical protein